MRHIRDPQRGRPTSGEVLVHRCQDGTYTVRIRYQVDGERRYERPFDGELITDENLHEYEHQAERLLVEKRWQWRYDRGNRKAARTKDAVGAFLEWTGEHREDSSRRRYKWACDRFLESAPPRLDSIRLDTLEAHRARVREDRSAAAVNNELAIIVRFLSWCVRQEYLEDNPAKRLEPLREELTAAEVRPRTFSDAEIEELRELAPRYVMDPINLSLWTGLRRGELIWLDFTDCTDQVVEVVSKASHRVKGQWRRSIELNEDAAQLLERRREELGSGPVFRAPQAGGRFLYLSGTARRWIKRVAPDATLHTARATFATRALEAGISLRLVQEWMGHKRVQTTQRYLGVPAGRERVSAARRLRV